MKTSEMYRTYQDVFEYHGNTEIERIRSKRGRTVRRDWLMFDSVEEAMAFFNSVSGDFRGCCRPERS